MKTKKIVALMLAVTMVFAFAACDTKPTGSESHAPIVATDPYAGKTHQEISDAIYQDVLGEFKEYYDKALAAETVSERYALMAIAEAKLLGSGVMLPSTANGGMEAISRVIPYTASTVLWGLDSYRYHNILVKEGSPLTAAERDTLKAAWKDAADADAYLAFVANWLTEKGYTTSSNYTIGYSSDPQTWDTLATYLSADNEAIINTYDDLVEYDIKNAIQPALATSWEVSEDGLTYTFHIRENVWWTDYQGTKVAELTAQDFVDGMHHMLDVQGGLEYLVATEGNPIIKNADAYIAGDITDFNEVGVKATDKYTLVYTLDHECSYFMTMLGYAVFAPMNANYYTSKGGVFGIDEFATASADADTYTYGTSYENILYCGPYIVTQYTSENTIVFEANPEYWNKDNITINKLTWKFISGTDALETYNLMKDGTLAGCSLTPAALQKAKEDGIYEGNAYVSATDGASFPVFHNLYRTQYCNFNDENAVKSEMTDAEKLRANIAMQNKNFRLALSTALDRAPYNAAIAGEAVATTSLVNSYTPGNFVYLEEEVTVKIGGADKTYPAGTFYGVILQDELDADGIKIKVWDPTAENGLGSSSGFDGWYNAAYSVECLTAAVEELKAKGVEISAENPLVLEMPYYDVREAYAARAAAYKQSIEATTNGLIQIRLIACGGTNALNWYYAGYYPSTGDEMNYNMVDVCGWGPDYGDPATYLDTMLPMAGGMAKNIGLY